MAAPRPHGELTSLLRHLDRGSYKAYRDLRGAWAIEGATLFVDRVQGDPFAAPSRVRLRVPLEVAGIPAELFANPVRAVALRDALARTIADTIALRGYSRKGSGKSGLVSIDDGRQTVLDRSAVVLGRDDEGDFVEARLEVGLPAAGRRILGREAETLLCETLPRIADASLRWSALPQASIRRFVACVESQAHLRAQLDANGLVAFVANGALLPRRAGDSDLPMRASDCVAFESAPSLEVELELLHPIDGDVGDGPTTIRGMGVPRGVTLIVGGGYHGKSTLLQALERCVHPHVPGDGREWVVSAPDLVKVRAEDGRPVSGVDLRAFIGSLPSAGASDDRSTERFTTSDASGSTSQAASIVEALEAGATGLLLDEDTCATNFMIRDARMQALVADADEPITPFVDRVRALYEDRGVSTVLVMGGSGDYFDVADTVIAMKAYRPEDVTERAKAIAAANATGRHAAAGDAPSWGSPRRPLAASLDARRGKREVAIKVHGQDAISWGEREIDLRGVAQLADTSQTRAIAGALLRASASLMESGEGAASSTISELLDAIESLIEREGLDGLALDVRDRRGVHPGALARPRRHEIAAALNRLRELDIH